MQTTSNQPPMGLIGQVTGRIGPGTVGEILVSIRQGRECFLAYPANEDEQILVGSTVLVVEYHPLTRSVYVVPWDDSLVSPLG